MTSTTVDFNQNDNTLTIFLARRIYTMDESMPVATAVGVIQDRIVAVGDLESMEPWRKGRKTIINRDLENKFMMPGFIDNHLHPYLGGILTPMEIIAPEPWRMAGGEIIPAARTPEEYKAMLLERLEQKPDKDDWFISFGYQPSLHGKWTRKELDDLCPDRPVILWQRSYHESYLNSAAIDKLDLPIDDIANHPQVDLEKGHFFETGNKLIVTSLLPYLMRPEWYYKGLNITADLMQQGGVTTAADLVFGSIDPEFELTALKECIEKPGRPLRIVNVCDARGFSNRAVGQKFMGPPSQLLNFSAGVKAINKIQARESRHVKFNKSVKFFADGAMFSQLMQMKHPGYIDGHHGEWLMTPDVLKEGVRTFWNAGYQIHVHVNGDEGMDSVLAALELAQEEKPRFDHRFIMHHVGFHTNAQSLRMAALGAHASVNPYYIYSLADDYSQFGLGPERASQLVRCASLLRNDIKVSFHSDFMMAPIEPLFLAWCAGTRTTRLGKIACPEERLSIDQALRGITIDAAYALKMDDEIGSICAGKKADFTILMDDPFDRNITSLKDVRIAGTIFEGETFLLDKPYSSIYAEHAQANPPSKTKDIRSQPFVDAEEFPDHSLGYQYGSRTHGCCGSAGDPCEFLRQIAVWWRNSQCS